MTRLWRVYYNRSTDRHPWSIDSGPDTEEMQVDRVTIKAAAVTNTNLTEPDIENKPRAWFEVRGTLHLSSGANIIAMIEEQQ